MDSSNVRCPLWKYLAEKNADLTLVATSGDMVIHLACRGGNPAIVLQILRQSYINRRGINGWTPGMYASVYGHRSVFDLLSSRKADLALLSEYGDNVLHLARQGGNSGIVQQVLTTQNIYQKGLHGWTPIMYAAVYGQQAVFHFVVSQNADCSSEDSHGNSILHLACQGGHMSIVRYILPASDINCRGMQAWTPIMYGAIKGHEQVFGLLVSHNADVALLSTSGDSVLHLASRSDKLSLVQHLLTDENINSKGNHSSNVCCCLWTTQDFCVPCCTKR